MPFTVSLVLAAATLAFSPSSAGEQAGAMGPDFTAGGKKDESHDWLLGPTGLRGWMFFRHEDLMLQVLGAYSATAPYDCPKSKAIFEQGCRLIAEKGFEDADIPDHLNALALLASGDEKHHSTLSKYATKAAESVEAKDTWNWSIAYHYLGAARIMAPIGRAFAEAGFRALKSK